MIDEFDTLEPLICVEIWMLQMLKSIEKYYFSGNVGLFNEQPG